ncbi:14145_t:CDS:2, partial [Funneliformis geosporum]
KISLVIKTRCTDAMRSHTKYKKKIAKLLEPEQNANMYSILSVKNRILKKQLEDYYSQPNTLERR